MPEVPALVAADRGFRSVLSWPVAYAAADLADEPDGTDGPDGLFPEEARLASDMPPLRRAEFAAGRRCAREVLRALNLPPTSLPRGPAGEPLWPPGISGSISHSGGRVCAAASRKHPSLGIDIQSRSTGAAALSWAEFSHPSEVAELESRGYPTALADTLLFSLREAAFKCLFPVFGRPPSFRHLHLDFPAGPGQATVMALSPGGREGLPWVCLQARFVHDDGFVLSLAWLDSDRRDLPVFSRR